MKKINPSVKALTVLFSGLLISFSYSIRLNLLVISVCAVLLLLSRARLSSILKVLLPATLAAASLFFAAFLHGNPQTVSSGAATQTLNFALFSANMGSFSNALQLALRIYAYAFLGMLFALTTDSEEFIYSLMQQLKLSPKFAYGVLAAYHLLPTLTREYASIRMAYKVKGCKLSPFSIKPVFSMLVNTMHWSENVAMAMESKGFDGTPDRSYYIQMQIQPMDWCFAFLFLVTLLTGFVVFRL